MAQGDNVLTINEFTGLNTRESANAIGSKELSSVFNFDLGQSGQLEKRTGVRLMFDNAAEMGADDSIHILGFLHTDTLKQFVARSGQNLYFSTDAVNWTVVPGGPWGDVQHGVQYTDKFYMVRRGGTVLEWNGAAITAIANSPSGTFCMVFKDRLFVIDTLATGAASSRLYFSNALNLSSTGWPATNYVGVQEGDGDRLVCLAQVSDYLLVFKARGIWNLFVQGADTLSWILRPFRRDTGCVSRFSVVSREGVVFFCGVDGIYTTDGTDVKKISAAVENFFVPITTDATVLNSISAFFWRDKYIVAFPAFADLPTWSAWGVGSWNALSATLWSQSASKNVYLVFNLLKKGWTRYDFANTSPHRFVTVTALPSIKGVYCGERAATGRILKIGEEIFTDLGAAIVSSFETKNFDMDRPAQKKRGKWVAVEVLGGGTYNFAQIVDQNRTVLTSSTVTAESQIKTNGPGYFRNWRFKCSVTSSSPIQVFGVTLYSTLSERPVKTTSV